MAVQKEDEYNPFMAYAASKTADVLFAAALARRYGSQGIVAASCDVGGSIISTNLGAHFSDAALEPCKSHLGPLAVPLGYCCTDLCVTPSPSPKKTVVNVPSRTKSEGCMSQMTAAFDPAIKGELCKANELLRCEFTSSYRGWGALRDQAANVRFPDHNGAFILFGLPRETAADHAEGEENEKRFWELSEKLAEQKFK